MFTVIFFWKKYPTDSYIKETAGSVTNEYTFIGGDSYSAPIVAITQSGTTTYYNILRDYLGNITHVVNATTGAVTAEYSFDAWGRMRDPSTWVNFTPGSEPALFIAGRGFTGHEHLPWFNLINMNGRVYDALIGSFLSPDNYVQSPDLTQNFNRYGYCLNNPLKYSDPSGMLAYKCDIGEDPQEFYTKTHYFDQFYGAMLDGIYWSSGGGGAGGGDRWFNSYLNYSHSCSENGGEGSVANFEHTVNTAPTGSTDISIQTGTIDYYTFTSTDGGKSWYKGNYINSKPIYSTIQVGSSDDSRGWIFGQSIDITIATPGGGYTGEGGWLITENGKKGEQFLSHGISFGLEATVGWNLLIINPKSNFKFDDLKGQGASWTANFWIFSISAFTNSSPSYPVNSVFDSYKGFKIGIGIGGGFSTAPNSNTIFKKWIPEDINYLNFHWH